MIKKNLNEITIEDFQGLIDNEVIERKTLDYKLDLFDNSDGTTNGCHR